MSPRPRPEPHMTSVRSIDSGADDAEELEQVRDDLLRAARTATAAPGSARRRRARTAALRVEAVEARREVLRGMGEAVRRASSAAVAICAGELGEGAQQVELGLVLRGSRSALRRPASARRRARSALRRMRAIRACPYWT